MPKRGFVALLITTGALILLLSFKTPDETLPVRPGGTVAIVEPVAGATPTPRPTRAAPGATATPTDPSATATPAGGAGGSSAKTVDGPVISTRFGQIQVEVVVTGGKLTDVVALQLPAGRRSGSISNYAEPILHHEALQAQSAKIDTVSGATYTSDGYAQSLQAALDQAGL